MLKLPANFQSSLCVPCFVLWLFFFFLTAPTFGMVIGGGGGGSEEPICTPDDPLVILPGPIGSPVRIASFDNQSFLVADYTRRKLLWYQQSGTLTPFIETLGRPLSIAVSKSINPSGKIKEVYYFVGNDDARTIDIYYEKNDQFLLLGQYPVGDDGIQALDMEFDQESNQLFVVDGLDRDIKVIQPDGQLTRRFGFGVLADPKGIALGSSADGLEIFVSDYGRGGFSFRARASIEVFNFEGGHVKTILGSTNFSRPQGLTVEEDKIYLTESLISQVLEINRTTGEVTTAYGCKGSSEEHLLLPMDVVLGNAGQGLYIADNRNMRVTVLPLVQP